MRKAIMTLTALLMVLSLAACGGGGETADEPASAAPSETPTPEVSATPEVPAEEEAEESEEPIEEEPEADPHIVDSISLEDGSGRIEFTGFSFCENAILTSDFNFTPVKSLVLDFNFINKGNMPVKVQDVFDFDIYQNGVSIAGDRAGFLLNANDYETIKNFFDISSMKDIVLPVSDPFVVRDDSPISVMVQSRSDPSNYQIMELIISDEETETASNPIQEKTSGVNLGDTIQLDFVTMTLDDFEISDNYTFKYTDKSSGITIRYETGIESPGGMKLVCLKGSFTNKTKNEIYPANNPAEGLIIINGNEYKTRFECFNVAQAKDIVNVAAQQTVDYFYYAEVPDSVADAIETCEVYIGFNEDLDPSGWISSLDDYDYLYRLDAIPEK